jgi:hypothetical protein
MSQSARTQPLTLAEHQLANSLLGDGPSNEPVYHASIGEQIVRGDFLRSLICGEVSSATGLPIKNFATLHIRNALVVGAIDLSECGGSSRLPHLDLENTVLTKGAILSAGQLSSLRLTGCYILGGGICAQGARFDGDVALRDCCFSPNASLGFARVRIEGNCIFSNLCCIDPLPEILKSTTWLEQTISHRETQSTDNVREEEADAKAIPDAFFEGIRELFPSKASRAMLKGEALGLAGLVLRAARISGDLDVEGLYIRSCMHGYEHDGGCKGLHPEGCSALDAGRIRVEGTMSIRSSARCRTIVYGGINVSFADISGHMRISGVRIICGSQRHAIDAEGSVIKGYLVIEGADNIQSFLRGAFRILGIEIHGQLLLHGVLLCGRQEKGAGKAIIGDGAKIHSDVFIRSAVGGRFRLRSIIRGMVSFPGAIVDGQLVIRGTRISGETRKSRAVFMRDIYVKGGIFLSPFGSRGVEIHGEIHLNDAVIGGVLELVGCRLTAGTSGFAVVAMGINIKADLLIAWRHPERVSEEGDYAGCRVSGGIIFSGATIGGRVRIFGASLRSRSVESALVCSGATIKGGFFVQPSRRKDGRRVLSTIVGALRINNVQIGSRIRIKGTLIHASNRGQRVAISANGAVLTGDVLLSTDDEQTPCRIYGEIRLYGARISGALKIQGGRVRARSDGAGFGCAIDGYNAEIAKGVLLGPDRGDGSAVSRELSIYGILGFAYTKLGSFSLGESRQPGIPELLTLIEGQLRLNGAQINEFTAIEQVVLYAPTVMPDRRQALSDKIMKTLNRWDKTSSTTAVSARSTNFGTRLSIRLSNASVGMLDLFDARAITLDDDSGDALAWGMMPTGEGWSNNREPNAVLEGVRLNLNGFTYNRFVSPIGLPSAGTSSQLARRRGWLRQQYLDDRVGGGSFVPDAHIQLTSVFRSQGMNREADVIIRDRRTLQMRHGTMGKFDRFLQRLYGFCFGFGYSSGRAVAVLIALYLLNFGFAFAGHHGRWLVEGPKSASPSSLHLSFSFTPTAKTLDGNGDGTFNTPTANGKCEHMMIYALDQTLPVIHVTEGNGCRLTEHVASPYQIVRIVLLFAAWIMVPTALLTFSGILRETNK